MRRTLRNQSKTLDVIFINWTLFAWLARSLQSNSKTILVMHGSGSAGAFDDLSLAKKFPRIFSWLIRSVDYVVTVSDHLRETCIERGARSVMTIAHAVDVVEKSDNNDVKDKEIAIVFAGRFSHEKGIDTYVECCEKLNEILTVDGYSLTCTAVGNGPMLTNVLSSNTVDHMEFLPHEQLLSLYEQTDIVLIPSRSEGFGLTCIEAMSRGCIVVASRVGGLAKIISHEEDGYLVDSNDSADWARVVSEIIRERADWKWIQKSAYQSITSRYGWNQTLARWRLIVEDIQNL